MDFVFMPSVQWIAQDCSGQQKLFFCLYKPDYKDGVWVAASAHVCLLNHVSFSLGEPSESLHRVIDGRLVKYVDVPEDGCPVIVSGALRRYSAGELDEFGNLVCYADGRTKWASHGITNRPRYSVFRRATPEELA